MKAERLKVVRTMKSWNETPTRAVEGGPKISRALVTYGLAGDIKGETTLDYSMVYLSDSKAMFVGFEQVHGTVMGGAGTFVLRHEGTFDHGAATIQVQVVPASGTGKVAGMTGKGRIVADSSDPKKSTLELEVSRA